MKTIVVPIINEFGQYKGTKEVKINNNPKSKDYQKITALLPGIPCGYCSDFYEPFDKIEITQFYDIRQRNVNKLKGYFIELKVNNKVNCKQNG